MRALIAAGLLLWPLAAQAQSAVPAAKSEAAYPNNPQGTPQASRAGAPVRTQAVCQPGRHCPDKPPVSAAAGKTAPAIVPKGGVRTLVAAYPDSPVKTPAAETPGTAPK